MITLIYNVYKLIFLFMFTMFKIGIFVLSLPIIFFKELTKNV